ncbi:MAG: hypothetical protein IJK53_07360 [Erysipelotrichaceae bacterium]|nr:hypothetical protein [Clostridia bacterium]MBQ6217187.1 hypothetical protein [Erysipelotrichaceae bacterium]
MEFNAPKNFKRGRLIANRYTIIDLCIAAVGISISFFLELFFFLNLLSKGIARNLFFAILFLVPAGIALLFIAPAGIYHNIFTFLELKLMTVRLPKVYIYEGVRYYGSKDKKTEQDP